MMDLALLAAVLLVAASVGRQLLAFVGTHYDSRLDRLVFSTGLGLGIIAYLVLMLGLVRLLSLTPVICGLVAVLLLSWQGLLETLLDLHPRARRPQQEDDADPNSQAVPAGRAAAVGAPSEGVATIRNPANGPLRTPTAQSEIRGRPDSAVPFGVTSPRFSTARHGTGSSSSLHLSSLSTPVRVGCLLLLAAFAAIALVDCFVPPGAHEWDALSYHLAAPKVFLQHHRILYLPTDHHSNFPFLVEMLFTVGLLFGGYALANLFHFALAALCAAALVAIGRRHFSQSAGLLAALVFASTPIVLWEAGAAYIELGMCLFVVLAVGAALEYRQRGERRWLALAGILMGFALSVKTLSLVPFVLIAVTLVMTGCRWKTVAVYVAAAVVVGCPFYIKSYAYTGNPVYPFAYRLFRGRNWSQELADSYSSTQQSFGLHNDLINATQDASGVRPDSADATLAHRLRNLLLAPFGLIAVPRIFYDYQDPGAFGQLGFLFLALPPLALLSGRVSTAAQWLAIVAGLWYLAWAVTMQYVRYVIPLVPPLALLGAEGMDRMGRLRPSIRWMAFTAVGLQVALVLAHFGGRLFVNPGDHPGQLAVATDPSAREDYLRRQVNSYASMQWLNQFTPAETGVVLFDEPRGFYLDRHYLWGNSEHSTYIPYPTFATGREMADWFLAHGIHYALVNLRFAQPAATAEGNQQLREAVESGTADQLFRQWYAPHMSGEIFRQRIGDAVATGAAIVVPAASENAAIVLQFQLTRASAMAAPSRITHRAPRVTRRRTRSKTEMPA